MPAARAVVARWPSGLSIGLGARRRRSERASHRAFMTVPFRGKWIDPVALWSEYVEFPANWTPGENDEFSPLVVCPNPDHQTTKRHFQVNLREPLVHCFTYCGISGTYEDAIAHIEGVTHRQARKLIFRHARRGSVRPTDRRVRKRTDTPISSIDLGYDRYLPPAAVAYLAGRGISDEIISRFELGWDAASLRIVIPVRDSRGQTRLLIRRTIKPRVEPRYLYTEGVERKKLLYGIDTIDPGMVKSQGIILVEGSLDLLVLWSLGIRNVVAILGSKVGEIQARMIASLRPKRIYTMFDADAAGVGATISAAYQIREIGRAHV